MGTAINLPIVPAYPLGYGKSPAIVGGHMMNDIPDPFIDNIPVNEMNIVFLINKQIRSAAFTGTFPNDLVPTKTISSVCFGKKECGSFHLLKPSVQPYRPYFSIRQCGQVKIPPPNILGSIGMDITLRRPSLPVVKGLGEYNGSGKPVLFGRMLPGINRHDGSIRGKRQFVHIFGMGRNALRGGNG